MLLECTKTIQYLRDGAYAQPLKICLRVEGYERIFLSTMGVVPEPQIGGAAALAAAELYELIGDEKYLEIGARFSEKILASQQSLIRIGKSRYEVSFMKIVNISIL